MLTQKLNVMLKMRSRLINLIRCQSYMSLLNCDNIGIPLRKSTKISHIRIPIRRMAFSSNIVQGKPKSNISDLKKYVSEDKNIHLRLIKSILDNTEQTATFTEEEIVLLLEQCGNSMANESCDSRNSVCQQIFETIKNTEKMSIKILNTYIKICTENQAVLDYTEIISELKVEPTHQTYNLFLWNTAEKGNVTQAFNILGDMKERNIPIDEEMFNALVLAHTIFGGLKDGEVVLQTMKAAKIPETADTMFCLLKGVSARHDFNEFKRVVNGFSAKLSQSQALDIFKTLSLNRNTNWLHMVFHFVEKESLGKQFIRRLEQLCIFLIHMKNPEAATKLYMNYVEPSNDSNYGVFLFREMLFSNIQVDKIIKLASHIRDTGYNVNIFLSTLEIALKKKFSKSAWELFDHLPFIRTHFFWPLILDSKYRDGEDGIIKTLGRVVQLKVPIDAETLEVYCMPYLDLTSPNIAVNKLKALGLTVKDIVNSMVVVLLGKNDMKSAIELYDQYNIQLANIKITQMLPLVWKTGKDASSIVYFLEKIFETKGLENDILGGFLSRCLKSCSTADDLNDYLNLLKVVRGKKLKMNSDSADALCNLISRRCDDDDLVCKLTTAVDELLDYSLKLDPTIIPHPKAMNVEQLECHLIELKNKGMETRGVLRKLIQCYANMGNFEKVMKLREDFLSSGYRESAGMKSSTMYTFVQGGFLEPAMNLYNELITKHKSFKLDTFKIIDLAELMVKNNKYIEAQDLIDLQSKNKLVKGGPSIERNCWRLLGAYKDEKYQLEMLNLLTLRGFCKPTNVLLGPLIRLQLNKGDLQRAVEMFAKCSDKYNTTPLKLELMCAVLKLNQQELLQQLLNLIEKVHGTEAANETLFVALTECRLLSPLRNFLTKGNVISQSRLEKVYDKWVKEDKLDCLLTVFSAHKNVHSKMIDIQKVQFCIIKIYSIRKDCDGAISFYEQLLEDDDIIIEKGIESELYELLIKCNYMIPEKLKNKIF